jgi:L-asparaginase
MEQAIKSNYDAYDGFVITHGTDTMAYTAAALSYLIQHSPKPIVLTGAQKPISMEVTDSKTNLENSFSYACEDSASGVVIVFGGKVILGTRARKVRTKSFDAFASINYPPLAEIQDGRLMQYITLPKADKPAFCDQLTAKVGLFKLIPGIGSEMLDQMLGCYDAVIVESYGVGGIPSLQESGFYEVIGRHLQQGKVVVMTTQVPNEGSDMTIYKVGHRLKERFGIIEAYDMTIEALTAKLYWLCSVCHGDYTDLRRRFYTPVANDILYREDETAL